MTVELRRTSDGVSRHLAVGRWASSRGSVPDADIGFGRRTVTVFADDVFTAAEAADMYGHYHASGGPPTDLVVRELGPTG